jgi:hypothetical protein
MAQPVDSRSNVDLALQKLGITDATAQLDNVISQTVESLSHRPGNILSSQMLRQLEQLLLENSGSDSIRLASQQYLSSRLPENIDQAMSLLSDELVDRVANFDVSLEMRGGAEKLTTYQQTTDLGDVDVERINLLKRLDQALQMSAIAAMMQTELAITADFMAAHYDVDKEGNMRGVSRLVRDRQLQLREQHMAEILLTINLYSYRFMPLQELERYVNLIERGSIQSLLVISQQALLQSLLDARARIMQSLTAGN